LSWTSRICVCGLGKVGKPILDTLRAKGFVAIGYDVDSSKSEASIEEAASLTGAAIFIVQTPSLADGSFSNEYLVAALTAFKRVAPKDYLYIISSTTVPGSCDKFREIVGDNLCYKPEFIRLACVRSDLLTPYFILIGEGSKEAGNCCEAIYRRISDSPIKRMSLIEAELAKITLNCALTMKVSLANQLHLVAGRLGANSEKIMDAVGSDPRIGRAYLQPGWPYGGPCLPRDNRMFQYVAAKCGAQAPLSLAADIINDRILGPEKEGWSADARDIAYQSCTG
jgi:UDPglucose 6-dehydrogenase